MQRVPVVLFAVASALVLSACGEDRSSAAKGPEAGNASATVALEEVGETRTGLQAAQKAYASGDRVAAEEGISEAYVSHFEEVEGSLGKRDEALNERLEETIREDLRKLIERGAPRAEVQRAFDGIYADLDRAEALLK